MRLVRCSDLKLQEFIGSNIPPYATLSHTWETTELLFSDLSATGVEPQRKEAQKLIETCRVAARDGYEYVWVDTCCIDKTSSAELTEAINSMFSWYKQSARCYVYLSDFSCRHPEADFSRCRWFTRGWTLQELVAPLDMHFYDKDWVYFGSKAELGAAISGITGIERPVLTGSLPLFVISVAKKMSWASKRETTRVEDLAYCLLGIFNINMPLVYGEGHRAFTQLQEEIIKETNDLTLFAWQAAAGATPAGSVSSAGKGHGANYRGILAQSPREFSNAGTIVSSMNHKNNPDFAMTNKGLRIQIPLRPSPGGSFTMALNCHPQMGQGQYDLIGIYLVHVGGGVYVRDLPLEQVMHAAEGVDETRTIYIMKHV